MIQYQILQNNMVRIVWHGESLMSSLEGKYKLLKCLPKKLTLKIISANVVLENLFVQLTKLLICFSLFILLLFFFICQVGYLREVILKVLNLVLLFQTYWDRGTELIK